jgi:hypothetical protein
MVYAKPKKILGRVIIKYMCITYSYTLKGEAIWRKKNCSRSDEKTQSG